MGRGSHCQSTPNTGGSEFMVYAGLVHIRGRLELADLSMRVVAFGSVSEEDYDRGAVAVSFFSD